MAPDEGLKDRKLRRVEGETDALWTAVKLLLLLTGVVKGWEANPPCEAKVALVVDDFCTGEVDAAWAEAVCLASSLAANP